MPRTEEMLTLGGAQVRLETGEVARQAGGSALVVCGETMIFAAATAARSRTDLPYLPLVVDFRKRMAAAGRIPGSYNRRDGRPTDRDTLSSRLIDRSVRPLLPKGWSHETQVIVDPWSFAPGADREVLGLLAASAALSVSDIPFAGPVIAVRMGRVGGELCAYPDEAQRADSDLDLLVCVSPDGVVMLEGGGREVPEAEVAQAIALAEAEAQPALDTVRRLQERAGRKKRTARQATENARAPEAFERAARERVLVALAEPEKHARALALHRARTDLGHAHDVPHDEARSWFDSVTRRVMREELLEGRRIGGRGLDEVRPISGRTGWLPRCHGSALFTRGETQAVCTCTLGTARDAQRVETMDGQREERFLLHYAFPPYSVGEARPLRGPGRREIGHGHLARRALVPVLRPDDLQTYTIRVESTITESNGSSSMATVCGGSLALLDAGIELVRPVAGIAMGLVKDGDRVSILSDILGDEDHIGDMDFKVAGTEVGITAIQLDNKLGSLPADLTAQALEQARAGRLQILERMAEIRGEAREGGGRHAPRAVSLRIDPNRVGDLIGPGGRNIKSVEALGGKVGVEDDGSVRLFAKEQEVLDAMRVRVEALTQIPMLGGVYEAQVVTVKSFGCFVRIFEGVDGLLPGCQRKEGERVQIEVCGVNDKGKLVLREAAAAASS